MTDSVRETSCTNCLYHEVCKHKEDYLKVCENVFKSATKESFEFLGDVFVSCRFYKTATTIEKHGEWDYWPGWCSNHDSRLEDATCPFCGYEHPVIRYDRQAPKRLPKQCPKCNAFLDIHEEDK